MTTRAEKNTASWKQRAIDLAIRGLIRGLLALPYRWRVPFCGWVMSRIVSPLAGWPKRIRDNLDLTMPELSKAERAAMVRAVPNNVGRTVIEIYSGKEFIDRATRLPLTGDGVAVLEHARDHKQPVILATGHFGNYDAVRAALIARGFPLGALYRRMNNPSFNEHYVKAIGLIGQPIFERGRHGMAQMLRHLKNGGMLGILPDQRMGAGVKLSFFGQDALTALSAAELALKYDALLIPTYAIRQPDGLDFQIVVDAPIPKASPEEMTQALNDNLERLVRRYPQQWFWIHRRWKP